MTLTITDTGIPEFSGLTIDLPALPLSGFVGALIAKIASGKVLDAKLDLVIVGSEMTETLTVSTDVPFLAKLIDHELGGVQTVSPLLIDVVRDVFPAGCDLDAKLTL